MRGRDETLNIQYLGQRLSVKEKNLQDYACNIYAEKIALIDVIKTTFPEIDPKMLDTVREIMRIRGSALWIRNADILTNLALRVGRTTKILKVSEDVKDEESKEIIDSLS